MAWVIGPLAMGQAGAERGLVIEPLRDVVVVELQPLVAARVVPALQVIGGRTDRRRTRTEGARG